MVRIEAFASLSRPPILAEASRLITTSTGLYLVVQAFMLSATSNGPVGTVILSAAQVSFLPPSLPRQVQLHGPLPVTADASPLAQRLSVGMLAKGRPRAAPHTPSIFGLQPPPLVSFHW